MTSLECGCSICANRHAIIANYYTRETLRERRGRVDVEQWNDGAIAGRRHVFVDPAVLEYRAGRMRNPWEPGWSSVIAYGAITVSCALVLLYSLAAATWCLFAGDCAR